MNTENWDIEVTREDDCIVNFSVEIPEDEVDKTREEVIDEVKQEVDEPGFRKGNVPDKVIKTKYEPHLKQKVFEELVSLACREVYRENELNPVDQPQLTEIDLDGSLNFMAEVEVRPEVKVSPEVYANISIEIDNYEITDDDVQEKIDDFISEQTTMEPIPITRPIRAGDFVKVDMVGFTGEGDEIPGTREEDAIIEVGAGHYPEDLEEGLIDGKVGEELNINATFPDDFIDENIAGETVKFKIQVHEIQEEKRPDLGDEEILEKLDAESEEDFRNQLHEQMEEMTADNRQREIRNKIYKNLLDNFNFSIPGSLMEREKEHMLKNYKQQLEQRDIQFEDWLRQQGMSEEEMMEDMEEEAERRIRLTLILEAIASKENIEVTAEDFENHLADMAGQYKMKADQLSEQIDERMKKSMKIQLRDDKVLDYLIDMAEIDIVESTEKEEAEK